MKTCRLPIRPRAPHSRRAVSLLHDRSVSSRVVPSRNRYRLVLRGAASGPERPAPACAGGRSGTPQTFVEVLRSGAAAVTRNRAMSRPDGMPSIIMSSLSPRTTAPFCTRGKRERCPVRLFASTAFPISRRSSASESSSTASRKRTSATRRPRRGGRKSPLRILRPIGRRRARSGLAGVLRPAIRLASSGRHRIPGGGGAGSFRGSFRLRKWGAGMAFFEEGERQSLRTSESR